MTRITETVAVEGQRAAIVHFWEAASMREAVAFCRVNLDCDFSLYTDGSECVIVEHIEEHGSDVTRTVRIVDQH